MSDQEFEIQFWGVRGSIACPFANCMAYGGNTSCVEMRVGGEVLIFDSGTGIRNLGKSLVGRGVMKAHLMMSHTHWDHINGFPFFSPAFNPNFSLTIQAAHLNEKGGVKSVFARQMENPTFPVPLEIMAADISFRDFIVGDTLQITDEVQIATAPLNHPGGATGYRVNYKGRSACYITDTEHVPGELDQNILNLIEGADVVIYDSTYTDEEFPNFVGWGHSTWQQGVRLCQAAHVKQLCIFHHDPEHVDTIMVNIEVEAQKMWSGATVAREDMVIAL